MPTYISSGGATTNEANGTWNNWVTIGTGTATTTAVWSNWTVRTSNNVARASVQVAPPPPPTPEQIAERERQQRARAARMEQQATERREAEARAEELLRTHLTPEQIRSLDEQRAFVLRSERGNLYRIRRGRAGNIDLLEDGRAVARYCIHPVEDVPDPDTMLAQKFMLETDEAAFLNIANRARLNPQ